MAVISSNQAAFLRYEIENGNSRRRKVALQEISRRYRKGDQLNSEARNSFEKLINGIVLSDSDKKVVRWCLNALARLGTKQNSNRYVILAMQQFQEDPEIVAAAVAALSHMYNGCLDLVPELNLIDPAVRVLAAMQITDASKLDISGLKIDIDRSDDEVLKLALLVIGLNKDIQNLLHPKHSNGSIVKQLCQHDDPIVRQYSVWSVMENRFLTLDDLGISFENINNQPVNVQSKLLQLAAERETNFKLRREVIQGGIHNDYSEARIGLATGISKIYFSELEDLTIDWFNTESDEGIRLLLAEHFARFSDACVPYYEKAQSIVESEPHLTNRILLGAEGKPLYSAIKQAGTKSGMMDLFGLSPDLTMMFDRARGIVKEIHPMKVLFLASSPVDQDSLKIDRECRDIKEQLNLVKDKKVVLDFEHAWAARTDQIQTEILNSKPEVLHFSGHGGPGELVFEDHNGWTKTVSGEALAQLIALCPTIKIVLLNACYTESIAKLVSPHVSAVIGCEVSISDEAATQFTRAFYRALAHGHDVGTAFALGKNEISLAGSPTEAAKYKITLAQS
jgi:hypothetical protein